MNNKQADAELLPCPFCGEDRASYVNTNDSWEESGADDGYIKCNSCESSYGTILPFKEAISAWNTRTQPTPVTCGGGEALLALKSLRYQVMEEAGKTITAKMADCISLADKVIIAALASKPTMQVQEVSGAALSALLAAKEALEHELEEASDDYFSRVLEKIDTALSIIQPPKADTTDSEGE